MSAAIPIPSWLRGRVTVWQRRLNLDMWRIKIEMTARMKDDKRGGEEIAHTHWARGYADATMEFSAAHYNKSAPAIVDRMIVHELYHLIASREDDTMEKMVGTTGTVYKAYTDEQELIAEAFAHMMVKAYQRKRSV